MPVKNSYLLISDVARPRSDTGDLIIVGEQMLHASRTNCFPFSAFCFLQGHENGYQVLQNVRSCHEPFSLMDVSSNL
jgi:hypothetical protein